MTLIRQGAIRAIVTHADASPAANVQVTFEPGSTWSTDASGRVAVVRAAGEYQVWVDPQAPQTVTVRPGETTEVYFQVA